VSVCARLLVIWLLCVVAGTLAPFNFVTVAGAQAFAYGTYQRDPIDFVLNLALFVPFGALLQHQGRQRALTPRALVLLTVALAAAISLTVEYLQVFLPVRDSSIIDVAANTLGALIGVAVDRACGASLSACVRRWRARTSPATLSSMVAGLLMVALVLSAVLQRRARLSNWSSDYPLLIGNELTGDRGWRGRVFGLSLFDAATPAAAVQQFAAGESIVRAGTQIAAFDFAGSPPFKDATGHLPDIEWTAGSHASVGAGLGTPGRSWLQSDGPASGMAQRLRQTSAFTLFVHCATDDTEQEGPARIVSNSVSPLLRNFTLGQQGVDLVFRLRTPETGVNGYPLEVSVPGVFSDRHPREILVTYDGANLLVATAHGGRVSRTELTPGGSFAATLSSLNVRTEELPMYQLAYVAALALMPAVVVGLLGQTGRERRMIGAVWVVAFAILLEATMVRASGRSFDWGNVAINAGVGAAVFAAFVVAFSQPDLPSRVSATRNSPCLTT
jgi:VanZ family protein